MTETQRRIKAYKEALPALRERVIAVALLLAMSASMLTSASFAWISLSTAPEVSGMSTTVAANGNLEIALASGIMGNPIVEPGTSQVGDSSAREDQTITGANVTWGNLVNLSDPQYGLSSIELRPALLAMRQLDKYPLNGAVYAKDGRVVSTDDKYGYSSYVPEDKEADKIAHFAAGDGKVNYGVRAIAPLTYTVTTGNAVIDDFNSQVESAYLRAISTYEGIVTDDENKSTIVYDAANNKKTCLQSLVDIVQAVAQDTVNRTGAAVESGKKQVISGDLYHFYMLILELEKAMDYEAEALRVMANWMAYSNSSDANPSTETFKSAEELRNATAEELAALKVNLTTLEGHKEDYNKLQQCIAGIKPKADLCSNSKDPGAQYVFDDIEPQVKLLIDIGRTTIDGTPINNIQVEDAMGYLSGTRTIIIPENCVITNFEYRVIPDQSRMRPYVKIPVQGKVGITMTIDVKGYVYTAAYGKGEQYSETDYAAAGQGGVAGSGEATAGDTYGMAIDVWVRTNYSDSVLVLEGGLLTEKQTATTTDANGNPTTLYEATINEETVDVYQGTDGKWYYDSSKTAIDSATEIGTPTEKKVDVVIGYQGENRVWEDWESLMDQGYIQKDATTQGSGSCFVFYAAGAEQQKTLELLQAFTIAFLDGSGKNFATAVLDTENAYANEGKVTVPLKISYGVDYTDENGEPQKGLMKLNPNEATWITAVVYLNGTMLHNDNVLAASTIQGQLNIQFGTNAALMAPKDEDLMSQYRTITASVSAAAGSVLENDPASPETSTSDSAPIVFDGYVADGQYVDVTLTVDGEQPGSITGFFVRVINETQGTRGETITFTQGTGDNADKWTATAKLTSPGDYVLSSVLVDGMEYQLDKSNHPGVTVPGIKLISLSTTPAKSGAYMQTEESFDVSVTATIEAHAELQPSRVIAQFAVEGSSDMVPVSLSSSDGRTWTGSHTFTKSGVYTLMYVVADGVNTMDVPVQTRIDLTLGLSTAVYTDTPAYDTTDANGNTVFGREYDYLGPQSDRQHTMYVYLYDNAGDEIKNLTGQEIVLYYRKTTDNSLAEGTPIPMKWNGSAYEGVLNIKSSGEYVFEKVMVGSSSLTTAKSSPVFKAENTVPPEYVEYSDTNEDVQLVMTEGSYATMSVEMRNADTQDIYAVLVNESAAARAAATYVTEKAAKKANTDGTYTVTFKLPYEYITDGVWALDKIVAQFGKTYPENPDHTVGYKVFDRNDTEKAYDGGGSVEVLKTAYVEVTYGGQKVDSSTPITDTLTSEGFGGTVSTKQLQVNVTDYSGTSFERVGVTPIVRWYFDYDGTNSQDMGGYSTSVVDWRESLTSADGKTFQLALDDLWVAGNYSSTVKVWLDKNAVDNETLDIENATIKPIYNNAGPSIELWSPLPKVTVAAVDPAPGETFTIAKTSSGSLVAQSGVSNYISDKKDYVVAYMAGETNLVGWEYTAPSVTLKLEKVVKGDATLTMVNAADTSTTHVFNFLSGTTEAQASIGKVTKGIGDTRYLAGRTNFTHISIVYNNTTYTVQLSDSLTIEQPEAPVTLSFAGIPHEVAEEDIPDPIPSDASIVTVYLPKITWTVRSTTDAEYSEWTAWTANKTVRTDYSANNYKVFGVGVTRFKYFAWTEYIRTRTATGSTMEQAMQIASWTINGKEYQAGMSHEIELSGDTVANAIVTANGSPTMVGTSTTTVPEYQYGYAAGKDNQENVPSGGLLIGTGSWSYPAPKLYSGGYATSNINGYGDFW